MNIRLTDAQRQAAIEQAGRNTVLTSGAGCGKTAVLTQRFFELLRRSADCDGGIDGLVALTFTEKAALQMRQRLAELLAALAADSTGPQRAALHTWLDRLPEARISTIHSFAASLVRTHALTAGVDPAFAVLADDLQATQMADEAIEKAILSAVEADDEQAARLLSRMSFDALAGHIGRLLDRRTTYHAADYADADAIVGHWQALLEADRHAAWRRMESDAELTPELQRLAEIPCSDPTDKLAVWRAEKLELARRLLSDPAARTLDNFNAVMESPGGIGSGKSWGEKGTVKQVRDDLKAALKRFEPCSLYTEELSSRDRDAAADLAAMMSLTQHSIAVYTAAKRAAGVLDFVDLLDHANRLLADPQLCGRLAAQINQILVDECQDTDALQMDTLWRLATGSAEPAATPDDGRLFLVGDAKQSIYRFRGAQVEVFRQASNALAPDGPLNLDISFRTHSPGVDFVNRVFEPLMDGYEPTTAHRTEGPAGPSVEIILAAGPDGEAVDSAPAAAAAQAAVTAGHIRELIDSRRSVVWDGDAKQYRPAEYGDVAILFGRMTNSIEYERQLAALDVPYYVVAGTGFFHQQEIYDVLNALRVVDNPFDDIALVGILRSSLFGLDDNALMHMAQVCRPPYFTGLPNDELTSRLPAHMAESLTAAVEMIARLHAQKDAIGIDELIERILDATGYEATLLAQPQGKRKVGNVRHLASRGRAAAGMTLADFVRQMDRLTLSEVRYEQAAVASEADNVVRLMTIHKAKGLEFPVVVVPDLNAGLGSQRDPLLHRTDWGWIFNAPTDIDAGEDDQDRPLSFRLASAAESRDEKAEMIRKYYVALTRHEDHLVLVGADWRTTDRRLKNADSFLAQLNDELNVLAAIDAARTEIGYSWNGHSYQAAVKRCPSPANHPTGGPQPLGRKLLAGAADGADLAASIIAAAKPTDDLPLLAAAPLPLVGPLPASVGRVELAVTALCDFVHCPMLYRWRHELRVPSWTVPVSQDAEAPSQQDASGEERINAATAGTFFHRCMELMDFADPGSSRGQQVAHPTAGSSRGQQVAHPTALAVQVADEMELTSGQLEALTAELGGMIERFGGHELWTQIASAPTTHRELDFVVSAGPAQLRGQIDLLFADADGAWRIVDYKSDRLGPSPTAEDVAAHSTHHELQMLVYALAAEKHLGSPPAEATLYYLRAGLTHTIPVTPNVLRQAQGRLASLTESLIASRRSGEFATDTGAACGYCPYQMLCNP